MDGSDMKLGIDFFTMRTNLRALPKLKSERQYLTPSERDSIFPPQREEPDLRLRSIDSSNSTLVPLLRLVKNSILIDSTPQRP
jgi:hypothetical protein